MSKGISTQQRQILGAAVAVSRIPGNGEPVARSPRVASRVPSSCRDWRLAGYQHVY